LNRVLWHAAFEVERVPVNFIHIIAGNNRAGISGPESQSLLRRQFHGDDGITGFMLPHIGEHFSMKQIFHRLPFGLPDLLDTLFIQTIGVDP